MQSEFLVYLALLSFAAFGYVSARFYLNVTTGIDGNLAKLRKPVSVTKFLIPLLILLAIVFTHYRNGFTYSADVTIAALLIALFLSIFLLIAIVSIYLHTETREQAKKTTETRVVHFWLIASLAVAKFAWQAFVYIVKLSANSRSDGGNDRKRTPYGYHGYLSYKEESKRATGKRY